MVIDDISTKAEVYLRSFILLNGLSTFLNRENETDETF